MSRVEQALAEIARRRQAAEAATPGPWHALAHIGPPFTLARDIWSLTPEVCIASSVQYPIMKSDAAHIAANDPAHVLAVLDAAEATLRRHVRRLPWGHCDYCGEHRGTWPCPDTAAVLDLYAPEVAR